MTEVTSNEVYKATQILLAAPDTAFTEPKIHEALCKIRKRIPRKRRSTGDQQSESPKKKCKGSNNDQQHLNFGVTAMAAHDGGQNSGVIATSETNKHWPLGQERQVDSFARDSSPRPNCGSLRITSDTHSEKIQNLTKNIHQQRKRLAKHIKNIEKDVTEMSELKSLGLLLLAWLEENPKANDKISCYYCRMLFLVYSYYESWNSSSKQDFVKTCFPKKSRSCALDCLSLGAKYHYLECKQQGLGFIVGHFRLELKEDWQFVVLWARSALQDNIITQLVRDSFDGFKLFIESNLPLLQKQLNFRITIEDLKRPTRQKIVLPAQMTTPRWTEQGSLALSQNTCEPCPLISQQRQLTPIETLPLERYMSGENRYNLSASEPGMTGQDDLVYTDLPELEQYMSGENQYNLSASEPGMTGQDGLVYNDPLALEQYMSPKDQSILPVLEPFIINEDLVFMSGQMYLNTA